MKRRLFVEMACGLLVLLFSYTAFSKLVDFNTFKTTLKMSPLIGDANTYIAWLLPTVECIIVGLLLIPKFQYVGLYCSLILLVILTIYLLIMIIFYSKELPCTCGGVISFMSWKQHLLFNLLVITLTITVVKLITTPNTLLQQDRDVRKPV